jgi:hypothetical protein
MRHYLLLSPKGRHLNLEEDLIRFTGEYKPNFCSETFNYTPSPLSISRRVIRLYEIPSEGAINVQVSSQRDIDADGRTFDGLISCLGFDENGKFFKDLHNRIMMLSKDYQVICPESI